MTLKALATAGVFAFFQSHALAQALDPEELDAGAIRLVKAIVSAPLSDHMRLSEWMRKRIEIATLLSECASIYLKMKDTGSFSAADKLAFEINGKIFAGAALKLLFDQDQYELETFKASVANNMRRRIETENSEDSLEFLETCRDLSSDKFVTGEISTILLR